MQHFGDGPPPGIGSHRLLAHADQHHSRRAPEHVPDQHLELHRVGHLTPDGLLLGALLTTRALTSLLVGVEPTDAARQLLPHTDAVFRELDRARETLDEHREQIDPVRVVVEQLGEPLPHQCIVDMIVEVGGIQILLHEGEGDEALLVYVKMVDYFPVPIEGAIETRHKMAEIYLEQGERKQYIYQLKQIVAGDAVAGKGRTDRTKFLAAKASLVLAEPKLEEFKKVELVKPFKKNLKKKKNRMRSAIDTYSKLVEYQVGEVTAAATFYIAEIYYEFSVALMESERPTNLNDEELEQYELVIEEQAYPFEEKAIGVHEKNMELLDVGIYNEWIDKSIAKLAVLLPSRYAKTEQGSNIITLIQPKPSSKEKADKKEKVNKDSNDKETDVKEVVSENAVVGG